ncbi:MAG: hypothetical protein RIR97_982, partial [Pseudomonadota bacterium]
GRTVAEVDIALEDYEDYIVDWPVSDFGIGKGG